MVYIDADERNADWIRVLSRGREFSAWTKKAIDAECAEAYTAYLDDLRRRHLDFFAAHPALRGRSHPFAAVNREAAFPPGWDHLADALPPDAWHRHHLSGRSSQVLAVALLAAAGAADRTFSWLPLGEEATQRLALFEVELAASVLNERPRQTVLDYVVVGTDTFVAAEAKFAEQGFGICSCAGREEGICSPRIRERPYGHIMRDWCVPKPRSGPCSLSLAYQPVRNLAAAGEIAGPGRKPYFLLLYDNRNPYFAGSGRWPGWVSVLHGLCHHARVAFKDLSWQTLLARVDFDQALASWASEKHGLEPTPNARRHHI